MPRLYRRSALPMALLLLALAGSALADDVTIYRCTDAQGRLSLRDTPCEKGQRQQAVEMLRPRDPPPVAAPAMAPPTAAAPAAPAVAPKVVVLAPPQPVYECTTPDGERYTSDNPGGNPRWVPLWTLGYPAYSNYDHRDHRRGRPGLPPLRPATRGGRSGKGLVFDSVGRPSPTPPSDRPGIPERLPPGGVILGPGSWISDSCQRLPQGEVCGRLRERRWELDRHYNSALQSERYQIDAEQRDIDARLANDCAAQ